MGISMRLLDSDFFIPRSNIKPLYDILAKESNILPENLVENPDVEELNDCLRRFSNGLEYFRMQENENGDVIFLEFEGEKYHFGDHPECLEILIPYVQEGSSLCMLLEVNDHEKWLFKNGKILICPGHVVYDETDVSEEK